jgi:hypothetical protein
LDRLVSTAQEAGMANSRNVESLAVGQAMFVIAR